MSEKIFVLKLRERPFEAIKRGTKRIEIRANKKTPTDYSSINKGDKIIFVKECNCLIKDRIECIVKRKTWYSNVRELLEAEGTKYTLSSTDDIDEGIKSIESIRDYKKVIAESGVYAIELEMVKYIEE